MPRANGRLPQQTRPVCFTPGIAPQAAGSVLAAFGNTRVICAAMITEEVPRWMKEQGVPGGWLTAEYGMLPYSTNPRKPRDTTRGRVDGRSTEIQRLIGRALRAVVDLETLGPRTLWVDCDVLQADGGTRTAAITGACLAVALAGRALVAEGRLPRSPLTQLVAAVSVGIVQDAAVLDLDYAEDREASVDLNVVMAEDGRFVEVQGAGEQSTFSQEQFNTMLELAKSGLATLFAAQRQVLDAPPAAV